MPAVHRMYSGVSLCFRGGTCAAAKRSSGRRYGVACSGAAAVTEMPGGEGAVSQPAPSVPGARGRSGAARTGFNFLDDGAAAAVPHLPDVQQVVRVPVVRGPEVNENAGPAAPAVHHHPVIKGRVLGVRGRQLLRPRQVPAARRLSTGASAPAAGRDPAPGTQSRSPVVPPGGAGRRGPAAGHGGRQQQQQPQEESEPQHRRALPWPRARSHRAPRQEENADPEGRDHC